MSTAIQLGPGLTCDLERLIASRLLVQANSGGGKSWALRRLLEQSHGKVQQIVLDPEGEFVSLRAKFDYVYAARKDGDTAADPRTAALLAERILELGVSAIVDLYELPSASRIRFVKLFCEALVDAPRKLWHPALIILDEAHVYCPEKGKSKKEGVAESAEAVNDLATRGRKRGFCAVLATQRLAKLNKDTAAELNNVLIGRTTLDVDVKRAADALGCSAQQAAKILRPLPVGEFYGYGPAISDSIVRAKIGPVETRHPKIGALAMKVPAPTAAVRAVLAQLADLPEEADDRARTVDAMATQIKQLERSLRDAQRNQAPVAPQPVPFQLTDDDRRQLEHLGKLTQQSTEQVERKLSDVHEAVDVWRKDMAAVMGFLRGLLEKATAAVMRRPPALRDEASMGTRRLGTEARAIAPPPRKVWPDRDDDLLDNDPRTLAMAPPRGGAAKERVLRSLVWWEALGVAAPSREQVAFVAGYTVNGHFNNICGQLRPDGAVTYPEGNRLALTDRGREVAPNLDVTPRREDVVPAVRAVLKGEALRRVFDGLLRLGRCARADLAIASGYTENGHFNNLVGKLHTLGVATYPAPGQVALNADLFEEGER